MRRTITAGRNISYKRARIWAACVSLPVHSPMKTQGDIDPELEKEMNEVNALRLCAEIACSNAGIDIDELLAICRETVFNSNPQ